jgi:predicted site-specific integrase-resolvase
MKLSASQVAELLGLPEIKILRWSRQGKIPALEYKG